MRQNDCMTLLVNHHQADISRCDEELAKFKENDPERHKLMGETVIQRHLSYSRT